MVMFHGMDRHSGIRTVSQDAARTAGGHSAQDTARRDTEKAAESMSLPPGLDASATESKSLEVTDGDPIPNPDAVFPPLLTAALRLLHSRLQLEDGGEGG